ncbi:hypothetical protein LTR27_010638 [Elasticomyces elasticus]|nr:hypothetical protein LTR27_010638 [Elasticomyces elasticus]
MANSDSQMEAAALLQPSTQEVYPEGSDSGATDIDTYTYDALPTPTHFRLLADLRVDKESAREGTFSNIRKLRFTLQTFDSSKCPTYDCLSYTWGNPHRVYDSKEAYEAVTKAYSRQVPVICGDRLLYIGRNLYSFLTHYLDFHALVSRNPLARTGFTGETICEYLWIDAVCINQESLEERAQQVRMMDTIYKNAGLVIAWLGELDRDQRRAIRALYRLALLPQDAAAAASGSDPIRHDLSWYDLDARFPYDTYTFLNRAWCRRAWIMQEAVLAKQLAVFCGQIMTSFGTLTLAATFLVRSRWWSSIARHVDRRFHRKLQLEEPVETMPPEVAGNILEVISRELHGSTSDDFDPPYVILEIASARGGYGNVDHPFAPWPPDRLKRMTFAKAVIRYRLQEATDPRDKIYAFLGMRKSATIPIGLEPSYLPETVYHKVYVAATWHIIEEMGTLDVLSRREPESSRRCTSLPSWVPDYSIPWGLVLAEEDKSPFRASADSEMQLEAKGQDRSVLKVRASLLCTVSDYTVQARSDLPYIFGLLPQARHCSYWAKQLDVDPQAVVTANLKRAIVPSADVECTGPATVKTAKLTRRRSLAGGEWLEWPDIRDDILSQAFHLGLMAESRGSGGTYPTRKFGYAYGSPIEVFIRRLWRQAADEVSECLTSFQKTDIFTFELWAAMFRGGQFPPDFAEAEDSADVSGPRRESTEEERFASSAQFAEPPFEDDVKVFMMSGRPTLGYGPLSLDRDDEIWILAGARVPFISRPRPTSGHFELIGEAYVHGIMYGEAIGANEAGFVDVMLD